MVIAVNNMATDTNWVSTFIYYQTLGIYIDNKLNEYNLAIDVNFSFR